MANAKHPVDQLKEQLDPKMQQQVNDWLAKHMPTLEAFEGKLQAQDVDLLTCVSEIALNVCHMCHILQIDFEPEVASILLNQVAAKMAPRTPQWRQYAKQTSPAVVARRARDRETSGSS